MTDFNFWNRLFEHLMREPENPKWYGEIGASLCRAGATGTAEKYLKRVLELTPSDCDARYNYAMILYFQSKWSESAAAWRSYLELAPEDDAALKKLADCCYLAGDYRSAANNPAGLKRREKGGRADD